MKKIILLFFVCLLYTASWAQAPKSRDIVIPYGEARMKLSEGNYAEAIRMLQTLYHDSLCTDDKGLITYSIAAGHLIAGEYKEAERLLQETRKMLEDAGGANTPIYREVFNSLTNLYYSIHNYQQAYEYGSHAKFLFEESLDFGHSYVRCLSNLALVNKEQGATFMARIMLDVAIRQARRNYEAMDLRHADEDILNRLYTSVKKDWTSEYAQLLSNAAVAYAELGYMGEAVSLLKESISLNESVGAHSVLGYGNLATMYASKDHYREAVEYYQKAFALSPTSYEYDQLAFPYLFSKLMAHDSDLADLTCSTAMRQRAHQQYAFSFLSEAERQNYWDNSGHYLTFQNYVYQCHGNGRYNGAIYDNQLYEKGLLLRASNALYDKLIASGETDMLALYRSMLQLKTQLVGETDAAHYASLQSRIDSIDKVLLRHYDAENGASAAADLSWQDIRAHLADHDAAIEFYTIPDVVLTDRQEDLKNNGYIYCAAILRHGAKTPAIVPLIREDQLEAFVADAPYTKPDLYDALWGKLNTELKGAKNIYFTADRLLHKIAVESLVDHQGNTADSRWHIVRLSSTRQLATNHTQHPCSGAVVYGGIEYDADAQTLIDDSHKFKPASRKASDATNLRGAASSGSWTYLPGTLTEAEQVASSIGKASVTTTTLVGQEGTEASFKALDGKNPQLLHIATHGFYFTDGDQEALQSVGLTATPLALRRMYTSADASLTRSGLLLAGCNNILDGVELPEGVDDGILFAKEIAALNLRGLQLVTLSACETGLGDVSGEGVSGLQRAFKLAGAESILMSLWPVDDEATCKLMTEFYSYWIGKKMTKHDALEAAKRTVRETPGWEDPKYWAAFILLDGLD